MDQFTDGALCSLCKKYFDFACSGVTEQGYRKLGDRKSTWRCPACKNKDHSPKANTPKASTSTQSPPLSLESLHHDLQVVLLKLSPLAGLVEDVKGIRAEITNLQTSLNMAHEMISGFTENIRALETRVKNVEQNIEVIPSLQAEVAKINQELSDKEQWSRANYVEIKGIPYLKEEFTAASRKLKAANPDLLGFPNGGPIYINDHLTVQNKNLLSKAKALAKESNFQFVWVKHCKIMARKSPTSPIIMIKTERELTKIK
ncbi:hypothetical protein ABMA27_015683 [Loxostege sticticalis]|uniref:FP protein C-terminal domain-containing protein n=1 Tax=Loxostege sticticalis TaxID=481309 RepID=A0ABR3I8I8_LOXSC